MGTRTTPLCSFAAVRLSESVESKPRNLPIGRWTDCTEAFLDMIAINQAAALLFFTGTPQGSVFTFLNLCHQKKWLFEPAMILRSNSMFNH
jgi:hypothetical protein